MLLVAIMENIGVGIISLILGSNAVTAFVVAFMTRKKDQSTIEVNATQVWKGIVDEYKTEIGTMRGEMTSLKEEVGEFRKRETNHMTNVIELMRDNQKLRDTVSILEQKNHTMQLELTKLLPK